MGITTALYKGHKRGADGTSSPVLDDLKKQLAQAIQDRSDHQALSATYQSNYSARVSCGGLLKPACNNWLDKRNAENVIVASLNTKIDDLNKSIVNEQNSIAQQATIKIASDTAAANAKIAQANSAAANTALTDPVLAAQKAQSAKDASDAANKKLMIIGGIVVAVLLVGVGVFLFIKSKRNK